MRELLVRYLLGELDADEQSQLEKRLTGKPRVAARVGLFAEVLRRDERRRSPRRRTAPRSGRANIEARRRLRYGHEDVDLFDVAAGRVAAFAGSADAPAGPLGWSFADVTVAAGVCLAMSMLLAAGTPQQPGRKPA